MIFSRKQSLIKSSSPIYHYKVVPITYPLPSYFHQVKLNVLGKMSAVERLIAMGLQLRPFWYMKLQHKEERKRRCWGWFVIPCSILHLIIWEVCLLHPFSIHIFTQKVPRVNQFEKVIVKMKKNPLLPKVQQWPEFFFPRKGKLTFILQRCL